MATPVGIETHPANKLHNLHNLHVTFLCISAHISLGLISLGSAEADTG